LIRSLKELTSMVLPVEVGSSNYGGCGRDPAKAINCSIKRFVDRWRHRQLEVLPVRVHPQKRTKEYRDIFRLCTPVVVHHKCKPRLKIDQSVGLRYNHLGSAQLDVSVSTRRHIEN